MSSNGNPLSTMSEADWNRLLRRIKAGKCTPFLGAGACVNLLPTGSEIAAEWAQEHGYPMEDRSNLVRVAQYLAVQNDPMFPKEELLDKWFSNIPYQQLITPDIPHSILARLPLPIFITTNYDNFMVRALSAVGKEPHREVCRWNSLIEQKFRNRPSVFADDEFEPDEGHPVVFHLHGCDDMHESLVLTEDDYIDFLVRVSAGKDNPLPPRIQQAIAETSLLFIGYSLNDINFRVLFRGIINSVERSLGRSSFTIQFPKPEQNSATHYIEKYFGEMKIQVIWSDAREFTHELNQRWEAFQDGSAV